MTEEDRIRYDSREEVVRARLQSKQIFLRLKMCYPQLSPLDLSEPPFESNVTESGNRLKPKQ